MILVIESMVSDSGGLPSDSGLAAYHSGYGSFFLPASVHRLSNALANVERAKGLTNEGYDSLKSRHSPGSCRYYAPWMAPPKMVQ